MSQQQTNQAGGDRKMDADKDKKKKESILDLKKYLDRPIRVKFSGGREARFSMTWVDSRTTQVILKRAEEVKTPKLEFSSSGILKGFDQLLNLVLDGTTEYLRDPDDPFKLTEDTRSLGLVVCRGTSVVLICPSDGMESIANPFIQHD